MGRGPAMSDSSERGATNGVKGVLSRMLAHSSSRPADHLVTVDELLQPVPGIDDRPWGADLASLARAIRADAPSPTATFQDEPPGPPTQLHASVPELQVAGRSTPRGLSAPSLVHVRNSLGAARSSRTRVQGPEPLDAAS